MLMELREWLTAVAALVAVLLGALGLRTWRAQLRGTAAHDAARALLRAGLRLRDVLLESRSGFDQSAVHVAHRNLGDPRSSVPDLATDHVGASTLVYRDRQNLIHAAKREVEVARTEAEAIGDTSVPAACRPLLELASRHWISIDVLVNRMHDRYPGEPEIEARARRLEAASRQAVHCPGEPGSLDHFKAELQVAVATLHDHALEVMRGRKMPG